MSRFNYIKGRRAQKNKLLETEGKIRRELEHKATDAVNRIVKTLTPEAKDPVGEFLTCTDKVLNTRALQADSTKKLKKRLKVVKSDYYLLKQKVGKLQSRVDSFDEDTLGILWLKEALNNILITRGKDFEADKAVQKELFASMTNDQMAYLAVMTNSKPPLAQASVGQMFEMLRKMGITINVECIKPALPSLADSIKSDALGSTSPIYCNYVEGVRG